MKNSYCLQHGRFSCLSQYPKHKAYNSTDKFHAAYDRVINMQPQGQVWFSVDVF